MIDDEALKEVCEIFEFSEKEVLSAFIIEITRTLWQLPITS
jgi:hypothetical protein